MPENPSAMRDNPSSDPASLSSKEDRPASPQPAQVTEPVYYQTGAMIDPTLAISRYWSRRLIQMADSIVLSLQADVMSSDCDIINILRKAHVIATKLDLKEFDSWITAELNGYKKGGVVPDYRHLRGQLKGWNPYSGWIPTLISDAGLEREVTEQDVLTPIPELAALIRDNTRNELTLTFSGVVQNALNKMFNTSMQYALHITKASVEAIIEAVKNTVLQWTLKLESENILGEDMKFTGAERKTARSFPQQINYFYGPANVVNAKADSVHVAVENKNKIIFTYEKAAQALTDIKDSVNHDQSLSDEDKNSVSELLSEINNKIESQSKPSIIRSAFVGLKDFLINAGSSLAAGLVQAKIEGLF